MKNRPPDITYLDDLMVEFRNLLVLGDRKIRTTLRTYQIAGFFTVPSWKMLARSFHLCFIFSISIDLLSTVFGMY